MSKTIVILSTSPRRGGNSDALADAFLAGATQQGHAAEKIFLHDKDIRFCRGCLACQKTERCGIRDDVEAILDKMRRADVIVFATPVYFYEMCGQMKTLLDRTNPLFPSASAFRDIYLLATAADDEESAVDGTIQGLNGWISCFEQANLRGVIRGVGVDGVGAIQSHPTLLKQAFQMGAGV